ncbi:MAG: esterase family protein [Ruminococcus sp.]|nr:esterase family protein [Ruminococcus sp.]
MKKLLCIITAMVAMSAVSCTNGKSNPKDKTVSGVDYMESVKSKIVEIQPDEVTSERDGVKYAEPKKYTYYSKTAERDTNVNILLPPDYSEDKKYPVLYLLHGFYDNEDWMTRPAMSLEKMVGNLFADKQAEQMIIVMPYIFCSKELPSCTGMDLQNCLAYDNFINDLTTDLMPFVEKTFSVKKGRENTAITGFSMGGREALFIGFSRPDLFGYIGGVCPAPGLVPIPNSAMHPGQLEKTDLVFEKNSPYMLLISAAEHDTVVTNAPSSYHELLLDNKVTHLWHTISSTGHDASSVKPHLYNFLRFVFKA